MNLLKVVEKTVVFVFLTGVIMFVVGAAGKFSVQGYRVEVRDSAGRIALVVGGSLLVLGSVRHLSEEEGGTLELLEMQHTFPQELTRRVQEAKRFVFDTNLSEEKPRRSSFTQGEYRAVRDLRVMRGEIGFKRVEVIYHKERFVSVVKNLLKFEGKNYYVRYYEAPPKAIPMLHVMAFDDEHFYVGGFYPPDSPPGEEKVVHVHGGVLAEMLREYLQVLWLKAVPLNEGGQINWDELARIAQRLGMSPEEFDDLILEAKSRIA